MTDSITYEKIRKLYEHLFLSISVYARDAVLHPLSNIDTFQRFECREVNCWDTTVRLIIFSWWFLSCLFYIIQSNQTHPSEHRSRDRLCPFRKWKNFKNVSLENFEWSEEHLKCYFKSHLVKMMTSRSVNPMSTFIKESLFVFSCLLYVFVAIFSLIFLNNISKTEDDEYGEKVKKNELKSNDWKINIRHRW